MHVADRGAASRLRHDGHERVELAGLRRGKRDLGLRGDRGGEEEQNDTSPKRKPFIPHPLDSRHGGA